MTKALIMQFETIADHLERLNVPRMPHSAEAIRDAIRAIEQQAHIYQRVGVIRPDGEFTKTEGVDGEPVFVRLPIKVANDSQK